MNYKEKKWQQKRKQILIRDSYLCQQCKKYGKRVDAQMVHHIKPAELFPELAYDDNNLESLCNACHNKLHPEKRRPPHL